jgi:hypothetical protein
LTWTPRPILFFTEGGFDKSLQREILVGVTIRTIFRPSRPTISTSSSVRSNRVQQAANSATFNPTSLPGD